MNAPHRRPLDRPLDRRAVLRAAGLAALAAGCSGAPGLVAADRPVLTHGVQSGDVTADGALVWTRADRPARMLVQVAADPSFRDAVEIRGPDLGPATDFTGHVRVPALPGDARTTHYRVRADGGRAASEAVTGTFRRPPTGQQDVRFVWTGDVAGQGWGIDAARGGMRIFDAMRLRDPDFLLHSGDGVYADGPLPETRTLADGSTWRNLVTPAKSAPAQTLDDFRGQWAYNLLDVPYRAFAAAVPQIVQWDDHEVTNNWYPGEILTDTAKYPQERRVDVLAARAAQAFAEWTPIGTRQVYRVVPYGPQLDVFVLDMRSYRGPNDAARAAASTPLLGEAQVRWLLDALAVSRATWKVIAAHLPLGLVVADGGTGTEAVAQGTPGAPRGREAEIAGLLTEMRERGVRNVVWLTADVHHTAAHRFHPERAGLAADPFWEFVTGPAHAGAGTGGELDATFAPERVFLRAAPDDGLGPGDGYQHFGEVTISGGRLTVELRDQDGAVLWTTALDPV